MTTETLPLDDFIKDIFSWELRSRAKGRPIQVVSDFDETLSSEYIFSDKWNTHVPKIRADLSQEAQRLVNPVCLATARTPSEPVTWVMWHKLSRFPMPLVAENGAVLVWPSEKITKLARLEILASSDQVETMRWIQGELQDGLVSELIVPVGHEVVLRPGRVATVEIRSQEISTKRGSPGDYPSLTKQLHHRFPEAMSKVDIVSSGSSLGIQPKGVSKELGIAQALSRGGAELGHLFLVGIGDNQNDAPLFNFVKQRGGLAIGVRTSVGSLCDLVFDDGDEVSTQILKTINNL